MMGNAIYPGTFDPITYGHIDIIQRASQLFNRVIVTIAKNSKKNALFTLNERLELIRHTIQPFPNVRVEAFDGLLIDFANTQQCKVILRGIRTISDFDFEFQLAGMNRTVEKSIETLFLITDSRYQSLSSSLLKELATCGGELSPFVPPHVSQALAKKFNT